jgi:hypothetical protein
MKHYAIILCMVLRVWWTEPYGQKISKVGVVIGTIPNYSLLVRLDTGKIERVPHSFVDNSVWVPNEK